MAGSCLPTWSRVCGSALQCISCQPKDVISWNLDEPDSSVWDIMPWKASKLPQIEKGKKTNSRLADSRFPMHSKMPMRKASEDCLGWKPKLYTFAISWHEKVFPSLGGWSAHIFGKARILQNAQSQVSRRISDEAVGCDSMYSQCIDFSNLPNRDEHVAAHRTFLSWKISKKLEPSVAAPEYTCLIVPILKCGKSSNYCEN